MRGPHIIQKKIFQIDIESESVFKTVSEQLMQLMKNELRSFIDETLTTLVPQNEYIQIDQLEIDLGNINLSNLKEDVIRAFKTLFPLYIKEKIAAARNQKTSRLTSANRALQSLLYFIAYGKPAWWMPSQTSALGAMRSYLQQSKRAGLVRLWNRFQEDPVNRLRLLHLVQIDDLLTLYLSTSKGVYINDKKSWQSIIGFLVEHISSIPGRGKIELTIKENLINFILQSATSKELDPLQFDPISLLLGLSIESMPPSVMARLRKAYRRSYQKELTKAHPIAYRNLIDQSYVPQAILEVPVLVDFKIFLERGYMPRSLHERGYSNVNELFQYLLKHHLDEVGLLLKVLGRKSSVRSRFLNRIAQNNITLFFKKIAPEKAALFDWIAEAYISVQETFKPINQTNISVIKSINEITYDIYTKENLNNLSNEAFLEMHFQRMGLKYNIKTAVLLGMVVQSMYDQLKPSKHALPFNLIILERLYKKKAGIKFGESSDHVFLTKTEIEANWKNKTDKGFVIPTAILKELLELKKSGLLGKHTVKLHALLHDQLKQRKAAKGLEDVEVEDLFSKLALLLQIDEAFLKNVLLIYNERQNLSKTEAHTLLELAQQTGSSALTISNAALLDHLLQFRDEYQPKEIKKLIEGYIVERKISLKKFEQLVRIIFKDRSSQIIKALEIWFRSNTNYFNRETLEQLQSKFVQLSLQFVDPERNLHRIFLSLQETLPEQIRRMLQYPQEVKQVFSDMAVLNFEQRSAKKKSPVFIKEKQLLAFYSILQLDDELEGIVNDAFYKNVVYSFDLLRGKYRTEFIEILRKYSIVPEFIDFVKEESNLPLWRAIVSILPEAVTRKVVDLARSVDFLFSFLSLTNVSKDVVQSFILTHSISFYFSTPEDVPDSYSFFIHLLAEAEKEGLLVDVSELNEINLSNKSWITFLREIKNKDGKKKLSLTQKLPVAFLKVLKEAKTWPSEHLIQRPILSEREVKAQSAYFMLQFVLNYFAFPVGHPFETEDIDNNTAYFREVFVQQPSLLIQIQQLIKTPRQQKLFNKWMDLPLAITFISTVFNETEATVRSNIQVWLGRFPVLKEETFAIQLTAYYSKTRQRKTMHELIVHYLIEQTKINVLDILSVLKEADASLSISILEQLPEGAISWKDMRSVLQIYLADQPNWFTFVEQWRVILEVHAQHISEQQKRFVFLPFIKEDITQFSKLSISRRIISAISFLDKISTADAVAIATFLYKEGVDIAEWIRSKSTLKTIDLVAYEQLIPLIIRKNAFVKSISTITDEVLIAIRQTVATKLRPSTKAKQFISKITAVSEEDQLEVFAERWQQELKKEFPFLFASTHFPLEAIISLVQKKWSAIFIEVYTSWIKIFEATTVRSNEPISIFLFRKMLELKQKHFTQSTDLHKKLLLESLQLTAINDNDIFIMITQLNASVSLDILLQPDVFYGLSTKIKDHYSFSQLLETLDVGVHHKWEVKLNQTESTLEEESTPLGFEKKELTLIYQDEFLYSRIQSASVPPEVRSWLDIGIIDRAEEKKIKRFLLELPVIFFLKEPIVHQQAIAKIAEWINFIELNRQFQLMLNANIKSAEYRTYFQKLLSSFFDKADKQTIILFLSHFHKMIQRNRSWNKMVFWEQLLEDVAYLPSMEKAIIQTAVTGKTVRQSLTLKKILKWQLTRTKKQVLSPLVILEKYVTGDYQDLLHLKLSVKDIKKTIKTLWGSSDKNFPYLLYKWSSQEAYRKQFVELMKEFGEKSVLDAIHPNLLAYWNLLEKILHNKTGLSVRQLLGIKTDADLWDLLLYLWSTKGYKIIHPMQLLREVFLLLIPKLNEQALQQLRAIEIKDMIYPDKEFWKRVLTIVPELRPEEKEKPKPWKKKEEADVDLPDEEDAIEGVTIQNAGLVLLWPYLNRFFKFLNLVDSKNVFINDEALARAIQLTQYLVNFKSEIDEQGLMLNKLLCGADFKFPVAPNFEPTPEESSLARKMLQGAVQNWEQMKNTRPETFQETFLQREGRLYKMDDHWELVVEKKAYDMLLDTLPWNISMIQLSWMSDRLVVIWR